MQKIANSIDDNKDNNLIISSGSNNTNATAVDNNKTGIIEEKGRPTISSAIVIIDDNKEDLMEINFALAEKGLSTIPIHFQIGAASETYKTCSLAASALPRIIITDIQMSSIQGNDPSSTDYGNVINCLKNIISKASSPYIILAWTAKPNSFNNLQERVKEYFNNEDICLPLPLYFGSISKDDCKGADGDYNTNKIFEKFSKRLDEELQIKALMHWEHKIFESAMASVHDLYELSEKSTKTEPKTKTKTKTKTEPKATLASILKALAEEVMGKEILKDYKSVAINEALSYILKDKVGQLNSDTESQNIWKEAIKDGKGGKDDLATSIKHRLNTLLHFDKKPDEKPSKNPIIRPGDLWEIENEEEFFKLFSGDDDKNKNEHQTQINIFKDEFFAYDKEKRILDQKIKEATNNLCKNKLKNLLKKQYKDPKDKAKKKMKIVAVEISTACDFANKKKALKSLVLGVIVPKELLTEHVFFKENSESIIQCPIMLGDEEYVLALSAKYILAMSEKKITSLNIKKILRVRESILQSWIHKIASYNSRIGTITFQ